METTEKPEPNGEPIVKLENIVVTQSFYRILRGVSASFMPGRTTVIMGTAGSGKSTFLKVAAGLMVPDEGCVYFEGADIAKLSKANQLKLQSRTGFVFQDAALWSNQTIWNNVILPLNTHCPDLSKDQAGEKVMAMLELVGYDESVTVRPADLSTGEQKLIGTARALILEPSFVFMDEPTASMDDAACERLYKLILDLKAKGTGLAIVTHSGELAQLVADRLIAIKEGVILADGEYNEVTRDATPDQRRVIGRLRPR